MRKGGRNGGTDGQREGRRGEEGRERGGREGGREGSKTVDVLIFQDSLSWRLGSFFCFVLLDLNDHEESVFFFFKVC